MTGARLEVNGWGITVLGDPGPFQIRLDAVLSSEGVYQVSLALHSDRPAVIPPFAIQLLAPMKEMHACWHPAAGMTRHITPNWMPARTSAKGTFNAPVMCVYTTSGRNSATLALSDCLNEIDVTAGAIEETALLDCQVKLFADPLPPVKDYQAVLRVDVRPVPYYEALRDVADWWASMPMHTPLPVPDVARRPFYSTWYSFHQRLTPEEIERQCRLFKPLGVDAIIVDDGWQTDDNSRGYAYCGDWEVCERKLPDFAAHVQRVHDIGMAYVVWFSVPFVGIHASNYPRFEGKFLDPGIKREWYILDPRFPDVREFLASLYEDFLRRYDIDGFKLDFVDFFQPNELTRMETEGRDCASVPAAVDRLLSEVVNRLRPIKPDVIIEFRQPYIGPVMRKYGNFFRAGDVPNDFFGNRVRTIDIRLLSGSTAAHSDMMMWHPEDSVESAAMQFLHTLFSVPQVSVFLDQIPEDHRRMVAFLLSFWKEHRDVLLDGELRPLGPASLYPVVCAENESKFLAAVYSPEATIPVPSSARHEILIVNGTMKRGVLLDLETAFGNRSLSIYLCTGERVLSDTVDLREGPMRLPIPAAGVARIVAQ